MSDRKELEAREKGGGSLHTSTSDWEQKCFLKPCVCLQMQ